MPTVLFALFMKILELWALLFWRIIPVLLVDGLFVGRLLLGKVFVLGLDVMPLMPLVFCVFAWLRSKYRIVPCLLWCRVWEEAAS